MKLIRGIKGKNTDYKIFFRILEKYGPQAFSNIDPNDPLMIEAEKIMEHNDQFFYFGDLIEFKIIYTSKRSMDMMGVDPVALSGTHFYNAILPSEMSRQILGRSELLKLAHDLFLAEKGFKILSTDFRIKNARGIYDNVLMQYYIFYITLPYKSVFVLKVHTNINKFKMDSKRIHYYLGDDLANFRFPDNELLAEGPPFSRREFEILRLIEMGCSSKQIANKLFISTSTVNTHRRNILLKGQNMNMSELIFDLKNKGLL